MGTISIFGNQFVELFKHVEADIVSNQFPKSSKIMGTISIFGNQFVELVKHVEAPNQFPKL
jgi:hypothetical protein